MYLNLVQCCAYALARALISGTGFCESFDIFMALSANKRATLLCCTFADDATEELGLYSYVNLVSIICILIQSN